MAYIYKIVNLINNKIYIGKTNLTIDERWKAHCQDYNKPRIEKRPLYDAMKKYGIENFKIEEVEECDSAKSSEREIYWINFFNSYIGFNDSKGYNATKGGDGKLLYNHSEILRLYKQGLSNKQICQKIGCCNDIINIVLKENHIKSENRVGKNFEKVTYMFNKNKELLKTFPSVTKASEYIKSLNISKDTAKGIRSHIIHCCNKQRKSAYGYIWSYTEY